MGKQSTAMFARVSGALNELDSELETCDYLYDKYKTLLTEFVGEGLMSRKRERIYWDLKNLSVELIPSARKAASLIANIDKWLKEFEDFLQAKKRAHANDLTKLWQKSLKGHLAWTEATRRQLNPLIARYKPIAKDVEQTLSDCEQAFVRT